ncbi:MAG: nitrous oxide reductase accessory protein NosL [Bacteroidia bacterium]|nr:nitrous oxide reductase accessory protein NosL [Bacteroidia bacterium]NNJ55066.1 hypothetical protein [Bacteroidia bacterium]
MKYVVLILLASLFYACSVEPQEINYGQDACSYCKMNIVDQQHAAEIVTKKGKVYKYDAIECMIRDKENNNVDKVGLYLVMDYNNPNSFLNAEEASFLISVKVPSPMGGNLSAFKQKSEADKMMAEFSGKVYSWNSVRKQF